MSVELELKLEAVRQGVPIKTLAERMGISSDRLYKSFSDPARSLRTIEIIKGARALSSAIFSCGCGAGFFAGFGHGFVSCGCYGCEVLFVRPVLLCW